MEELDPQFLNWVNQESDRIGLDRPPGGRRERNLLAHWAIHRPLMLRRLRARGAEKLAHVLEHKAMEQVKKNLDAGMPPTDATEQAERDWLLMEPESED